MEGDSHVSLEILALTRNVKDVVEEPQVLFGERPRLEAYFTMLGVMGKPEVGM